jgi:nucleoside-diphosphate-sugar epimerase
MHVVVTGATGNVGYALVKALVGEPRIEQITGIARRPPQFDKSPYDSGKFHWHTADVGRDELRGAFTDADAVVHLAWRFQPTRDAKVTWKANVVGTTRVMAAVAGAGVDRLVYASSVGAYSPAHGFDADNLSGGSNEPVSEDHPTIALPVAAYGVQKSYLERAFDAFEANHPTIQVVRIRSAFVFQRLAALEQRRIFAGSLLPRRIVGNHRLPVLPVPRGLRFQTVHAEDLANAYVRSLLSPATGAFNIAASPLVDEPNLARVFSARTVGTSPNAVRLAMATAYRLHVVPSEPGLFELFMSLPVLSSQRAKDVLGWSPRHTSLDALTEFLDGLAAGEGAPTIPLAADAPRVGAGQRLRHD